MQDRWVRLRQWLARSRAVYYLAAALFLLAPGGLAAFDGAQPFGCLFWYLDCED